GATSCATCGFFFSSRRRHTRSKRDWSSDVCSSDLYNGGFYRRAKCIISGYKIQHTKQCPQPTSATFKDFKSGNKVQNSTDHHQRSEERRVGNESSTHGAIKDGNDHAKDQAGRSSAT